MATTIHSHITFNGNCRQAMKFYQACLGGELHFQKVEDVPSAKKIPVNIKNAILHAQLNNKNFVLMGSDMVEDMGLIKGNTVSLVLNCESEKEIKNYYKKLSYKGKQTYPLQVNHWGILSGSLVDKYGIYWLLSFKANNNQ